jgi:hypothetical protein
MIDRRIDRECNQAFGEDTSAVFTKCNLLLIQLKGESKSFACNILRLLLQTGYSTRKKSPAETPCPTQAQLTACARPYHLSALPPNLLQRATSILAAPSTYRRCILPPSQSRGCASDRSLSKSTKKSPVPSLPSTRSRSFLRLPLRTLTFLSPYSVHLLLLGS